MPTTLAQSAVRQAVMRPDMLTPESPEGLRVVQITTDDRFAHSHIYMESPVCTPTGDRFVFQRIEVDPARPGTRDWRRQFWLCDTDDGFALRQLTTHPDATAPAVSPDGRWFYYCIDERDPARGRGIRVQRIDLGNFREETVIVIDRPLPATAAPPSLVYPLAAVRADGQALCISPFLGDGVRSATATWGLVVCDLQRGSAEVIMDGPNLINPHQQYSRSDDPAHRHDLLVQENFDVRCDAQGNMLHCGSGCLLYVVRDDGTNLRVVPTGDPTFELVHGHQEWRGRLPRVVVGVDHRHADGRQPRPLIEATLLTIEYSRKHLIFRRSFRV